MNKNKRTSGTVQTAAVNAGYRIYVLRQTFRNMKTY